MTRHFQLSSGRVVASSAVQPLLPISISEVPVGPTHEINTWASVKAASPFAHNHNEVSFMSISDIRLPVNSFYKNQELNRDMLLIICSKWDVQLD